MQVASAKGGCSNLDNNIVWFRNGGNRRVDDSNIFVSEPSKGFHSTICMRGFRMRYSRERAKVLQDVV